MKISVVIPLFNKKDSVIRTIESVLNQAVLPAEIIIVNDGSTDGSEKVVAHFNHPLITLLHQENAGVSAARNKGIKTAKEEWIAFLDADDTWKPNFLKEIIALRETFPACHALATAHELEDYHGNTTSIVLNKIPFQGNSGILTNYFEVASCSHPPICSSAVVVKKSAIQAIGGFPLGIKSGEDLLTWARLAKNNVIGYSLESLSKYYLPNNISERTSRWNEIQINNDMVTAEFLKILDLKNRNERYYFAQWFKIIAKQYLNLNNRKYAFQSIIKSISLNPNRVKIYFYLLILFSKCIFLKKEENY